MYCGFGGITSGLTRGKASASDFLRFLLDLNLAIEYDEDEERFVLVVVGRNGAWVDGVWSGSGSRVPLGDRYVVQPLRCARLIPG